MQLPFLLKIGTSFGLWSTPLPATLTELATQISQAEDAEETEVATTKATTKATSSTPTTVEPFTTTIKTSENATSTSSSEEFPNTCRVNYYDTGMDAGGLTSHGSDYIVALSQ